MQVLRLPEIIEDLRDRLQFSLDDFAQAVGVEKRTVTRWTTNQNVPQGEQRTRIDQLDELAARLEETFVSREAAQRWLKSDSQYLGGIKPVEALRAQRIDVVNGALEAIVSGFTS